MQQQVLLLHLLVQQFVKGVSLLPMRGHMLGSLKGGRLSEGGLEGRPKGGPPPVSVVYGGPCQTHWVALCVARGDEMVFF